VPKHQAMKVYGDVVAKVYTVALAPNQYYMYGEKLYCLP